MLFIQGLLIAFFLFASSVKMFGWVKVIFEPQLTFFRRYGLNRSIMFIVGIIEATGAMFFHFRFDTVKDAIPSIITLILSVIVAMPMILGSI